MTVERIFISPTKRAAQVERQAVRAVVARGLENDRYFDRAPGRDGGGTVTLVEAEEIEAFLDNHGLDAHGQPTLFGALGLNAYDLSITRRNIVTRGVRLNDLVGQEFTIGSARLRGVELCEPCNTLGKLLQTERLTPAQVIKAFLHRGGLRAEIVQDGDITVGAAITPALQSAAE